MTTLSAVEKPGTSGTLPVYSFLILPWQVKDSLYLLCFTVVWGYHIVCLDHQDSPKKQPKKHSL